MAVFTFNTALFARAVLRRSHVPVNPSKSIPRRQQHTNATTKDEPANGTTIPVPSTVPNLPIWQRLGPLTRAGQAYGRSQRKRPYSTQFCSSLVIYFLGDLSAQNINGESYDWKRTVRALFISAGSSIPSYKWFMFLGNNFNYASKALSLITKVTVNQICFTPIFNTYFFGMQSLLSGDSIPEVIERIKKTLPISMLNSCKLWPAVTAFSFTFVDPQYRSIFAGFIAIGWQTYLSFLNRKAELEAAIAHARSEECDKGVKQEAEQVTNKATLKIVA